MSASPKTASASGTICAPCASYRASAMADPSPAPAWTTTSCPASASSRTPAGVSATRYSSVLISVGTPTRTNSSSDELAPSQREPELDAVAGVREVTPGQLLHLADPVAQRVAGAGKRPSGTSPPAPFLPCGPAGA